MATYKVLQDIEAEDKLFGPFTLKQFIFGAVAIILGFIEVRLIMLGLPVPVKIPLIIMFLPPLLVFGFLAAPIGRDQPNDVWLLVRLRFLFKPRVRIWNQDGISELVTITAPKKDTHIYTNNLSQVEVKSRLQALANTVDTRGWAVKNVNANLFTQPGYLADAGETDRLINVSELAREVPAVDVTAADDILDPQNNTTAHNLDQMIQQSTSSHKQQVVQQMQQPAQKQQNPAQDFWFMNQPSTPTQKLPQDYATFSAQPVVAPGTTDQVQAAVPTADEEALAKKIAAEQQQTTGHINDRVKVLQPLHDRDGNLIRQPQPVAQPTVATPQPEPVNRRQQPVNPVILELAHNDDLNVATLARQANKLDGENSNGEVVVSLH